MMIIGLAQLSSCQGKIDIKLAQYVVNGQKLYKTHCQNCHGAKGEGLGKLYPPLTDHEFLEKNKKNIACIIKNGLSGEIEINGQIYNQPMPSNKNLNNVDIAYIITYITNTFGKSNSVYTAGEVQSNLKDCL